MKPAIVAFFTALLITAVFAAGIPPAQARTVEQIQTYPISGNTGAELYRSIGQRGPTLVGPVGAIAHTTFKLTWQRDYRPQGNACMLVTARPTLVITYTLPKAPKDLPPAVSSSWARFIAGVERHERVHGVHIKEMVREIETYSTGLTVADDPACRNIRTVLMKRLGELSNRQRQRGRDFDQTELGGSGTVVQLVLDLVNGP